MAGAGKTAGLIEVRARVQHRDREVHVLHYPVHGEADVAPAADEEPVRGAESFDEVGRPASAGHAEVRCQVFFDVPGLFPGFQEFKGFLRGAVLEVSPADRAVDLRA